MSSDVQARNTDGLLVVTSALPYANGDIHLGHLVEVVQTDIYVRYKKMCGRKTIYVCADDTHGTPVQLNALKRGITCEALIREAWENHVRDYAGFSIGFDIFYTTNSEENRKWAEYIFAMLQQKGFIVEKEIEQYYCSSCNRFLPDRFISGTCPKCGAQDQYGDVCEVCTGTYDPVDLKNPKCMTCGAPPVLKKSKHFFVELAKAEPFLRTFLTESNVLQEEMRNFVMHWVDEGLKQWCISRDGPYFGFKIPQTDNKYFYVWLDAPIGYISSTEKWCVEHNEHVDAIWREEAPAEVVHFIGKDIVYFHTLFWPVMLHTAGLKLPSKVFVHGFLTIGGEKMSKTRGTFIRARDYLDKVKHPYASQYLRFYFGAKLTNNTADIDLNIDEFCTKVNTVLVNTIGNLHHRTLIFIERYFGGQIPDAAWDAEIEKAVELAAAQIARCYDLVEFKEAIEKIQALGNMGNKYYQDTKPWDLIKNDRDAAAKVMVTCVNLIKACAVFLKPVVPAITEKIETQFGATFCWNDYAFSLRSGAVAKTEKIVIPVERSDFNELFGVTTTTESEKPVDAGMDIQDFKKVELKVGIIKNAETIKKSDKLLKLTVDDGGAGRQIIAGIAKAYKPQDIIGRRIIFVANLKPATLMGQRSEGMVLAAVDGATMSLLRPDQDVAPGATVS